MSEKEMITDDFSKLKPEVIEAIEEARRISRDPNTKRYSSFEELLEALDSEDIE